MLVITVVVLIGVIAPSFAQTNVTQSSNVTSSSNATDTEQRFSFFGFNPWGRAPPGRFPGNPGPPRPGPSHPEFFDESSLAGRPKPNQPGWGPPGPPQLHKFSENPDWDRQDQGRPNWGGRPDQTVFPDDEDNRPGSWGQGPPRFPDFGGRPNNQNRPGNQGGQGVRPGNFNQGGRPNNQNQGGNFNQGGRPFNQNQGGNFNQIGNFEGPGSFNQGGRPINQNQGGNFGGPGNFGGRPIGPGPAQGSGNSQGSRPWNSPVNQDIRPVTEDTFETSPPSVLFIDQLQLTDPDTQQDPTNDFSEGFFRTTTRPARQISTNFPTTDSRWGPFTFPTTASRRPSSRTTSRTTTRQPRPSTTTVSSLNLPEATTAVSPCELRCLTTLEFNPVCGTDNTSYQNPQKLKCAQRCGKSVSIQHYGNCIALPSSTTTQTLTRG